MDVAIYPGSFDPITLGHLNILERALDIFSEVTLLVAINPNKQPLFSLEESMQMISEAIRELPRANVDFHDGLTVEYARQRGIRTAVRGLRAVTDFENEFAMALTNRSLWPEFDTVFLMTKAEYNELPPVEHPMVRDIPETGKRALYVGSHTGAIIGMPEAEAKPLIAELIEFATRPENIYTHKWSESDAVLWDNRAIVHRGRPFARDKHARVMIRTTIAGAGSKDVVEAA